MCNSGEGQINIDEINARQDQILNELNELDRRIIEIIELWTKTDAQDEMTQVEQAA